MRINRSTKSDSADLFFDIMSRFNSDTSVLKKEASFVKEASFTNLLKALKGGANPAGKAVVEALQSGGTAVDDALKAALKAPATRTSVMIHGIGHLIGNSGKTWKNITDSMGKALGSMQDDVAKYIDQSGNFTEAGKAILVQSIKEGGGVSDRVAKEILDGVLSGNAYNSAWKARSLSELGEAAGDAAGAGAKGTGAAGDAAGAGAKGTGAAGDAAGAGAKGTGAAGDAAGAGAKGTGAAGDAAGAGAKGTGAAGDAAGAASKTDKEIIDAIQQSLKAAKGATTDTLEATIKAIDDAIEMTKNLSPELAGKISKALNGSKSILKEQADAAASVKNVIQGNTFSNVRGNITITQAREISNLTLVADKALEKSIRSLGQHRRYVTELEEGLSGGRRIVDPPQPPPSVRPDPVSPGVRPDPVSPGVRPDPVSPGVRPDPVSPAPGVTTPNPGLTGDIAKEIDLAVNKAVKANLEEVTKAVTSGAKRYADSADDIAKQIKELKGAARAGDRAAAEALEEIAKAQKNFEKVVERFMREAVPAAERAGVKLASETTSVWTKINRFTGWLAKALLVGGGIYGASKLFGDHDGDGVLNMFDDDWKLLNPGSGGGGVGGVGTAGGGRAPVREQSRTGYRNVKDPKIIEALSSVDPSSPSYDRVNGWKDANKAIETLKISGRNRELRAVLKALKTIYDKRYVIELDPPFNVPGESTPLYYAFVNQRRGGPNLSDRTRRTLGLEQMSLNRALQGTDHKGVIKLFDVNNNLMASNAQEAMNETAETSIEKGFSEKGSWFFGVGGGDRRVDDYIAQELVRDSRVREQILQDISSRTASMNRKEELKKVALLSLEENNTRKTKLEEFAKTAYNSTNTNQIIDNQKLKKKADDFSESYYKDATTDLDNDDETLRSYFAGLGRLYDQRLENRKADFKELFNVTDETGEDLIYAAHPKEVVVSDSIGRGGLVENGLEQKRQSHGVALSAPTGNYRANYASRYDALKKISKLSLLS